MMMTDNLAKGLIGVTLGVVLAIGVGVSCVSTIPAGYNGIIYNRNGGLEDQTLGQGWHVVAPHKVVIKYPVSTEVAYYNNSRTEGRDKMDDSLVIGTKDGKTMKIDMQLFYRMQDLPRVFTKFRGADVESIAYGYMKSNAQRIANDLSSQYTMMDIVGEKKPEYNAKLLQALQEYFVMDGISIEQAGLGRVEPDEETRVAIQAVANAQYAQRQAEIEKSVAIANAERNKAVAEGEAVAKKIEADAISYYNQKVQQSASKEVVELKWIEKWDGKLPQYQLGEKQGLMIGIK